MQLLAVYGQLVVKPRTYYWFFPPSCRIFEVVLSFICMVLFGKLYLFLACIRIALYLLSIRNSQSMNYSLQTLMIVPSYEW
jgi:hypothetical protein